MAATTNKKKKKQIKIIKHVCLHKGYRKLGISILYSSTLEAQKLCQGYF